MDDVGRKALFIDVDASGVQRIPMRVQPFAERGDDADAGDPDFLGPGADLGSVMRHRLQWEADLVGHRVHVHAQGRVGEGDMAEGEVGAALQLACRRVPWPW